MNFLLRTHGVVEVKVIDFEVASTLVGRPLRRLLLDVRRTLLGKRFSKGIFIVGLDILSCERNHGQ
jgi:hypothetical protein